jgi:hypothetical protein
MPKRRKKSDQAEVPPAEVQGSVDLPDGKPEIKVQEGGYQAARDAVDGVKEKVRVEAVRVNREEEAGGAGGEQPSIDPSLALVMMSEVVLQVTIRVQCARQKVKIDQDIIKASKFTEEERSTLSMYAPYAVPFLNAFLLKYGKYVGGAIYLGMFYTMMVDRCALVKEKSPKKEDKKEDGQEGGGK